MRALVWPFVERHIRRHLPSGSHLAVLGDLEEDFLKQHHRQGRARAEVWLLRESLSLSSAYRFPSPARPSRRNLMERLGFDEARLALRRLLKQPGASIASVITLACGLAAAAATYSVLSAVLLSPLPVKAPEELHVVGVESRSRDGSLRPAGYSHVYPLLATVRDSGAFAQTAAGGRMPLLVGEGERPQSRSVYFASHDFFDTLGVSLAFGSGFRQENDVRGAAPVAVLSDRYWRLHLGADPEVVGRTITVAGVPATIVGVAPKTFRGLSLTEAPDLYMPLHTLVALVDPNMNYFMDGTSRSSPSSWLTIVGRLKPGDSAEQTASQLTAAMSNVPFGGPVVLTDINTASLPEAGREGMRRFGTLLATTVGLLLLIGSLTVGMLLLIRTEARRDEFAMCLALGASRRGLAAGVAVEGVLLAAAGVLLSIPLSSSLFAGASAFQLPGGVALDLLNLSTSTATLLAAGLAALGSSLLIGIVAGAYGVSANIADVLRSRAGATPRLARRRMRLFLVTAQVAVTLVLLAGAGLFARSLSAALRLNPGFDPRQVVMGNIDLRPYGYTPTQADEFFTGLQSRLRAHPAIESASMTVWAGGMSSRGLLTIDGERRSFPSLVSYMHIDEHYFETMGLRIVRGRDFTTDDGPSAPPVIIVSESFGRMLANGADPLGHVVAESFRRIGQPAAVVRIVGVVPDVVTSVAVLEPLVIYYSLAQRDAALGRGIVLRAAGDPAFATREAMAAIRAIDPLVTPAPMDTMLHRIELQMGPQTLGVTVLGALSVIAVLLTVLGTYVLAETMAAARQREMGIRAALGATRRQLGDLVLRETATLVGVGLLAGLGLAWLGAGTIRAFLFQVEPLDAITLASASALILTLALAVSLRPAVRAGRAELSKLLREE